MRVQKCWAHLSQMVFILHNLKRFSSSEISQAEFHYYYQNDMQMRFNFSIQDDITGGFYLLDTSPISPFSHIRVEMSKEANWANL